MNYIAVDFEWNQPMGRDQIKKFPVRLDGEIIQVGAVKFSAEYELLGSFDERVRPKFYLRMNPIISKLIGVSSADLKKGEPFPQVMGKFKEWCGTDFCLLTWGPDDARMLLQNIKIHGLAGELSVRLYNAQRFFELQVVKLGRQLSLEDALAAAGETEGRKAHDALNDAYNTYLVCKHIDLAKGVEDADASAAKEPGPAPEKPERRRGGRYRKRRAGQ